MKILLLEDEAMLRSSIKEFLEALGSEVSDFFDGADALDAVKSNIYDALVVDINVPTLNGYEFLEEVRKKDKTLPLIFITAMTDIDDITKAYNLGCSDYLKKPFKLEELWLRINQIFKLMEGKNSNILILSPKYRYDKKHKILYYENKEQTLSRRHLQIIDLFASNTNFTFDLDAFRNRVWERDDIDDATIRTEINRLRKLLKEDLIINA
ncbi:MAG: response regulator transcription factor, partial [Campylobacteraceae bacterium]|nr:response regulator transcription factor [Campylobacteraceae bacterium]